MPTRESQRVSNRESVNFDEIQAAEGTEPLRSEGSESSPLDFDIVFSETPSESSAPPASAEASPTHEGSCTWGAVGGYIRQVIDRTSEYIGRRVAANYWRMAISDYQSIRDKLRIAPDATVEIREPGLRVDSSQAEEMDQALYQWRRRAQRVISDVLDDEPLLDDAPWNELIDRGAV